MAAGGGLAYATGGKEGLVSFGAGLAGGYIGNKIGKSFISQQQEIAQSNPHEAVNQVDGSEKPALINKETINIRKNGNSC